MLHRCLIASATEGSLYVIAGWRTPLAALGRRGCMCVRDGYVCGGVCVCVCVCVCMCGCVCVCMHARMHVCVCMHACMYAFMHVYVCMFACMWVDVCVHVCV